MGWFKDPKTGLICMMWLSLVYFFVEIIVGYMTNSMALVADSFHMLGDVAAMVIAFVSVKMSPKKWSKNTFGWARAEVLGALVNAVFLVALCFSITIEAIKRIVEPEEIHNPAMLAAVGGLGLVINLIGLAMLFEHGGQGVHHGHTHGLSGNTHTKLTQLSTGSSTSGGGGGGAVANGTAAASAAANSNSNSTDDNENNSFMQRQAVPEPIKPVATTVAKKKKAPAAHHHGHGHGHSHGGGSGNDRNMNMHGVYLHVLSDALGSIIVVISALVVWLTEWEYRNYLDPALSVLLVVLMLRSVWPLLRESAMILLQTVPTHIQVDAIQQRLLENVDGVLAVHEFHVWQLAGDRIIASAHIRCRNLSEYMKIAEKVKEFFHHEGIHSTTIQPEFVELEQQSVTDGVSTNLNISGSHDSCVLDCPTTDDGCVQATCCQNNNKMPTLSPTSSPFLCRQRTITSRQNSDIESGSLLTSAVVAPPSPIATGVTLPLTASASHMAAGPPPLAIVTATSETGGSSSGSAAAGVATITPTSIVVAASSSASTSTTAAATTLSTSAASAISGSSSNLHQTASAQLQNQQQQPIV